MRCRFELALLFFYDELRSHEHHDRLHGSGRVSDGAVQELRTDKTLAELRSAEPRDEREFALVSGFMLWTVTTLALSGASLLFPEVLHEYAWFWRGLLTLFGLAVAASHVTWMRRLPPRSVGTALFVSALLTGLTTLGLMLLVEIGFAALTINLLSGVVFAAYFLPTRRALTIVSLATLYSFVPLLHNLDGATGERMASRLVVWIPVMWLVAAAIHVQNRERRAAVANAERKAMVDPLTGIANLRALRQRADVALRRARRNGSTTALMLVDIQQFRDFIVRYGHGMGDAILCAAAGTLTRAISKNQLVARTGGDIFAVLIENAKMGDIADIEVRLQRAVSSARIADAEDLPPLEAYVGVSCAPQDGDTLDELLTAADRAVNSAKLAAADSVASVSLAPIPDESAAASGARWPQPYERLGRDGETKEPVWLGRPLNSVFAASGWFLAIALVLAALAMPDADRSHLDIALPVILFAAVPATLDFFFTPRIGSVRHLVNDFLTLGLLGVISFLTGGSESPAWPFVYIVIAHSGWFVNARGLALRMVGVVALLFAPLFYEGLGHGQEQTAMIVALYCAVVVAVLLALAMGFNRLYMERAQAVAQRLTLQDPLTGLPNRYAFKRIVGERIDQLPDPAEDALALVILDLYGFRRVNSALGHGTGDTLLCEIATRLRETVRSDDLIARVGGDEFAAVMRAHGQHDARALAERLVRAVDDCVIGSREASAAHVSACAGFALYPTHGRTVDELTGAADLALLNVKAAGRGSRVSGIVMRV